MKKRILGLALVLVMLISLLPLTALADDPTIPMPKLTISYPNDGDVAECTKAFADDTPSYIGFQADADRGMIPVILDTKPQDTNGYIEFLFKDGVLNVLIDSVNYDFIDVIGEETANKGVGQFIHVTNNDGYTKAFDTVITLKGNSVFDGIKAGMTFATEGNLTVTGDGSLTINTTEASSKCFALEGTGNLTILNTTLKLNFRTSTEDVVYSTGSVYGIYCTKDILIEGSEVEVHSGKKGNPIRSYEANVVVKNSDLIAELTSGSKYVVHSKDPVVFENSNVTLIAATGNKGHSLEKAPSIIGTYSAQWFSYKITGEESTLKDYAAMGYVAGDTWKQGTTAGTSYNYFKLVHKCEQPATDDGNCETALTCACTKTVYVPAKQHIAGEGKDDCTKDTMCGNPGCTQKYADKLGEAHVAAADDNDCTTDILCSNPDCTQVVTKGAAKHAWDRPDCSVDGACTTPGCTQTVAAGVHTGGTATCKAKAKCDECGDEYGELGACAPAADDGDCTTDIKCSVCGKTTTAGEAAHKYTDKNDATCDNAGCTNTRKVEGTENPKTGDNSAIAVVAALMVTAAAAFVTTKKFAR